MNPYDPMPERTAVDLGMTASMVPDTEADREALEAAAALHDSPDVPEAPAVSGTPEDARPVCTEGVTSEVLDGGGGLVGHVLLGDYDDGPEYGDVMADALEQPGLSVILQSSPGSFHLWNLTVRGLDQTALQKLMLMDDDRHAGAGYRGQSWVVRIGPKRLVTPQEPTGGETYKEPPEILSAVYTPTCEPQSQPHADLLADLAGTGRGELDHAMETAESDGAQWVGSGVNVQRYYSGTDSLKAIWEGGEADE